VDRQLLGGEGKVLHGQYIVSVDIDIIVAEDNLLNRHGIVSVDRQLIGGETKVLYG
jgi:hypothetical protein